MAKLVEKLGIADGAASIGEAALAWVTGAAWAAAVEGDVYLESGMAVLVGREHVIAESPKADGMRDEAENIDHAHLDLIILGGFGGIGKVAFQCCLLKDGS